jgi:hypothetical protein
MTDKETMKLALDALETEVSIDWTNNDEFNASAEKMHEAITALKERLAQTEPLQDKYQWLVDNAASWNWVPSRFNAVKVSGFAHKGTGYLGYSFDEAVCLAIGETTPPKENT